jgi:DNA-binding ferritin-like protein (Dps family)
LKSNQEVRVLGEEEQLVVEDEEVEEVLGEDVAEARQQQQKTRLKRN